MRRDILARAMGDTNKAFQKQVDDIKKRENVIALRCYNTVFSAADRAKANSLPQEWLRDDDCLRFNVNGMHISLDIKEPLRVPPREGYCHQLGVITGDLADQVMEVVNAKEKMREDHAQIRAKLDALLDSCTTTRLLETTWPEGKPFYGYLIDAEKEEKAGLPAVLISDINKALHLDEAA
jgi:hypothetical protein